MLLWAIAIMISLGEFFIGTVLDTQHKKHYICKIGEPNHDP